ARPPMNPVSTSVATGAYRCGNVHAAPRRDRARYPRENAIANAARIFHGSGFVAGGAPIVEGMAVPPPSRFRKQCCLRDRAGPDQRAERDALDVVLSCLVHNDACEERPPAALLDVADRALHGVTRGKDVVHDDDLLS